MRSGVEHLVFNLSEEFDRHVVEPYVAAHAAGRTPNPCIECNRRVKFATFAEQARLLGFDAVATGHHARIGRTDSGELRARARCRPGQGPELRGAHARSGRPRPHRVPGRRLRQVRGASPRRRARAAHRRQARQPGRVLHHVHRRPGRVPAAPHRDDAGARGRHGRPAGRHGAGGGAGHRRSTQGARACRAEHRSASSSRSTGRPPPWSWATRTSCRTTDSLSSR